MLVIGVIQVLATRFSLKEPNDLNYFVGVEATRTSAGFHLMQNKYIIDLLTKTKMLDAKPVTTPMAVSAKLTLRSGTAIADPHEFRMIVGSLQYLSITLPDIAYSQASLSVYASPYRWSLASSQACLAISNRYSLPWYHDAPQHTSLFSRVLGSWLGRRYRWLHLHQCIHYVYWCHTYRLVIKETIRRRSIIEYRAVAYTAAEMKWVCSLLTELGITLAQPPVVFCDNVGATYLSANPVFHSRMKHLAFDFHFVRENVQTGALHVTHVSTRDQLADALTKPLPRTHFTELISKIGVVSLPPSWGGVYSMYVERVV